MANETPEDAAMPTEPTPPEQETDGHPQDDSSAAPPVEAPAEAAPPAAPRPGLTVPFILVALQLLLALYFGKTSTIPFQVYVGIGIAPLVATVGLLIWWMCSFTVPMRQRVIGAGFAAVAAFLPVLLSSPMEVFLLVYVLPSLTTLIVLVLIATQGMRWNVRRNALLGAMTLCSFLFCLTKVAGVDGNMAPILAWRWAGPPELIAAPAATENQVAVLPKTVEPEDWPAFRGARRDNRNMIATFGTDWGTTPPKELWRRPVGLGWSSFAVIGNYCFTQEQRGAEECVVCYEVATGNEIWVNAVSERFDEVMGSGPRATPTFHQGRLYTQGATGILQCIDAATGKTVWKRDLREDAQMKVPQWGFSSSPLVAGELVIAYSGAGGGKSVRAYKLEDGEPVWESGNGHNGYSSPHWAEVALVPQILQISNYGIEAFEPTTGKVLWEDVWDIKGNPRVSQPYVIDFYTLIAGTGQGKGARLLKVEKPGDTFTASVIFTSEKFRPYFNDFVFHDGYLYGFDGMRFACMDASNGFIRWTGERLGGQLLALNAMDTLVLLTEAGEVMLVDAYPSTIEIRAHLQALNSKTWNHPVVARGKLFVRNDREAVCYELPPVPVKEEAPKTEEAAAH